MIDKKPINPIRCIRFLYGFLLAIAILISIQCTSKDESPQITPKDGTTQITPKDGSPQANILSSLHVGLPLDSAKILTDAAGWVCDTTLTYTSESKSLLFRIVRIPNIDYIFVALLNFKNGRLENFGLNDVSGMFSVPNTPPAHNQTKYKQFEAILESIYGHPTYSGTNVNPLIHPGDHVDTTFITTWANIPQKSCTLQYDALYDRLSFVAF